MAQIAFLTDYSPTQRAVKLISNEPVPLPTYHTIGGFQNPKVVEIIVNGVSEVTGKTLTTSSEIDLADYGPAMLDVFIQALAYIYEFADEKLDKPLFNDLDIAMLCIKAIGNEHSLFYRYEPE